MSRNRRFTGAGEEFLRTVGGKEDAYRRHTNCGSTPVMAPCDPRGIGGLVKFPKGLETRMHTLCAMEQFTTDTDVRNIPIGEDGARDGNGHFGVVRGFTDPPFALRIPQVSGDDRPGSAFETPDALGIPVEHVLMRQHLCLLTDRVAGSDALEAAEDAISSCESHNEGMRSKRVSCRLTARAQAAGDGPGGARRRSGRQRGEPARQRKPALPATA